MGVLWAIELNAMAWVGTQTPFAYGRPRSVSSLLTIDTTGLTTHCYRSAGSIAISKYHSVRDRSLSHPSVPASVKTVSRSRLSNVDADIHPTSIACRKPPRRGMFPRSSWGDRNASTPDHPHYGSSFPPDFSSMAGRTTWRAGRPQYQRASCSGGQPNK